MYNVSWTFVVSLNKTLLKLKRHYISEVGNFRFPKLKIISEQIYINFVILFHFITFWTNKFYLWILNSIVNHKFQHLFAWSCYRNATSRNFSVNVEYISTIFPIKNPLLAPYRHCLKRFFFPGSLRTACVLVHFLTN